MKNTQFPDTTDINQQKHGPAGRALVVFLEQETIENLILWKTRLFAIV
jgi:hypothetical protein